MKYVVAYCDSETLGIKIIDSCCRVGAIIKALGSFTISIWPEEELLCKTESEIKQHLSKINQRVLIKKL